MTGGRRHRTAAPAQTTLVMNNKFIQKTLSDGGATAPVGMHSTADMEDKHGSETTIHSMLYGYVMIAAISMKLLQLPISCHAAPMATLLNSGASHNFISSAVLKSIGAHKL